MLGFIPIFSVEGKTIDSKTIDSKTAPVQQPLTYEQVTKEAKDYLKGFAGVANSQSGGKALSDKIIKLIDGKPKLSSDDLDGILILFSKEQSFFTASKDPVIIDLSKQFPKVLQKLQSDLKYFEEKENLKKLLVTIKIG